MTLPFRRRLDFDSAWSIGASRVDRASPRVAHGLRIYAIGDIHGRVDLLEQLLSDIDADLSAYPSPRAIHVFLGDYVDRGPASREVVDRLIQRAQTHELCCLKGNHESFLLDFLDDPTALDVWQHFGGLATLLSYGLKPSVKNDIVKQAELAAELKQAMPDTHLNFVSGLRLSFSCGDFFFTHAGVRPGVPLARQREEDLLWIRDEFLSCSDDFGKIVIHGHTPVSEPDIRPNRINIDTGAFATGRLTCLIIGGEEPMVLEAGAH